MSGYTYTPMDLISSTPTKLADGSLLIGDQTVDKARVGEKIVGRGNAGEGKGAGSNIFKANAIQEVFKRGRGDDGTYMSNGGLIGNLTGITEKDVEDYATTKLTNDLKTKYSRDLKSLGIREVQWGDTESSIQAMLQKAREAKALKKSEPGRIKKETQQAQAVAKAENREITAENERNRQFAATQTRLENNDKESARRFDAQEKRAFNESKERRLDRQLEREMSAENNMMQMNLEYARLERADKRDSQDRKDRAILTLIQGLGNLGTAFTV